VFILQKKKIKIKILLSSLSFFPADEIPGAFNELKLPFLEKPVLLTGSTISG
jgi:hypothetical protein